MSKERADGKQQVNGWRPGCAALAGLLGIAGLALMGMLLMGYSFTDLLAGVRPERDELVEELDEHLDEVALPYYDPHANRMRAFKPDFIFWLQKGTDYHIVFVDPKGTTYAEYEHKVDGYRQLFEDDNGQPKVLHHDGLNVSVSVFLHTEDRNKLGEKYGSYWFDGMGTLLRELL
jgi:hypothetical protein